MWSDGLWIENHFHFIFFSQFCKMKIYEFDEGGESNE
ncbi:hypothetical protein HBHAL_3908 [Halobacillus halophilus DSM 2266]|uniref:Uncharacterized protein n=1 Tax=Halobacillus halophilus (strain ATCC 35676 / DSM 2266 / JCM 20832 / KCTC 3685 / LMG 17431 / NBRC 102448 / NCIMB 2269) TaxID=866895 RepID=I0JQ30_HALH3|nr:hypothetical protein HBHAL_3908 [Halobacillus halophilus DSM 2266]